MLRGMYSAASAMDAAEKQQEVLAQNVAHSSTFGYRQQGIAFETFDRVLGRNNIPTGDLTGTTVSAAYTDFHQGALEHTTNMFDMAIDGDSFFVLNGPRGPLYTRNGSFHFDQQRQLVSEGGYPFRGATGPIQIPETAQKIEIASDGTVAADRIFVGQLDRVRFNRVKDLEPAGITLFRAPPTSELEPSTARVLQGYREASNVSPSQAIVTMMLGMRYFEASQRALNAIAESIQLNTKPQ